MIERPGLHARAVFQPVADYQPVAGAAEMESINRPAISAHQKSLERTYDLPLTECCGRLVAAYCTRRILALADEMMRLGLAGC